jgi:hypothetical protein
VELLPALTGTSAQDIGIVTKSTHEVKDVCAGQTKNENILTLETQLNYTKQSFSVLQQIQWR